MTFLRALRFTIVFAGVLVVAQSGQHDNEPATTHPKLECSQCHQVVASIGSIQPSPSPMQECRSCHPRASLVKSDLGKSFHSNAGRACSDCHSFHRTANLTAGGADFRFSPSSGKALCAGCHTSNSRLETLSRGHLVAAKLFHSNSEILAGLDASQACLICHSQQRSVQIDGADMTGIPQFTERHMHPVGEIQYSYVGITGSTIREKLDPRLPVYNNRIECQTCHDLTAQTRHRLIEFETPEALCNGCHEIN